MIKFNKNHVPGIVLWSIVTILAIYIATLLFAPADYLEVAFIDVGQGDAAFIRPPSGTVVLLDAGGDWRRNRNVGRDVVGQFLIRRGVRSVDKAIVSHFHEDHGLGFVELAEIMRIHSFFMPDTEHRPRLHYELVETAERMNAPIYYLSRGHILHIDENTHFEILFPLAAGTSYHSGITFFREHPPHINDDSLVMRLHFGNTTFLFTGDIEERAELVLLREPRLNSDVLKVAHHGSRTSTMQEFLDAVNPRYAVISAGLNNQFNHPHPEVMARLTARPNLTTFRTDLHGTITFLVDQNGIFTIRTSR